MSRHVLVEIVEQHAEEAAFLWILRNEATRAPNQDLTSLSDLDERIDAHLDGLRVAGAHGWDICREQLAWREAGEIFAATHIAIQSRVGKRLDVVLEVANESVELARGFIGALAWLPYEDVERIIHTLLASTDPLARRIGLAASAAHRRDPGAMLGAAALDSNPAVCARAVKAAAELGRRDLTPLCVDRSDEASPESRFWHAWAATILGGDSCTTLRRIALDDGPFAEPACDLAARRMSHNDVVAWQGELVAAGRSRLAIVVARALGDPARIPWLIEAMDTPSLARIAGEAFASIAGVDLAGAGLAAARPEGFESGPNDDPNDDNIAIDPDEHLPWPRQPAVAKWWSVNRATYTNGERYLMGRPIDASWLHHVLQHGRQRLRAAAAVELVLAEPGQPLFGVKARADRQLNALRPQGTVH